MSKETIFNIVVTSYCDQKCEFCSDKNLDNKPFSYFDKINFDNLYKYLLNLNESNILLKLEGGEPTFHPDLINFCRKIKSIPNIKVEVYSNFKNDISIYNKLLEENVELYLTFHENLFSFKEFLDKIDLLIKKPNIIFMLKENVLDYVNQIKDINFKINLIIGKIYTKDLLEKSGLIKEYNKLIASKMFNKIEYGDQLTIESDGSIIKRKLYSDEFIKIGSINV